MAVSLIVERGVGERISFPDSLNAPLHITDEPLSTALDMMREHRAASGTEPLELLFFLSAERCISLAPVLQDLKSPDVYYGFCVFGSGGHSPALHIHGVLSFRTEHMHAAECRFLIDHVHFLFKRIQSSELPAFSGGELSDSLRDQESLIRIGKSLSLERNPDTLLRTILLLSKKITGADAGSIFLVEDGEAGPMLRFKQSHTFSVHIDYSEFLLPINADSIAGYVAMSGQVLNIDDAYLLPSDSPVSFNPDFDRRTGYHTKSMLVVPMRGNMDRIIGVIQLINSKECQDTIGGDEAFTVLLEKEEDFERLVYPFPERYEGLMEAVAGQAAVAIENNRMLKQIQGQFEAFVKASVKAIESRDPATSGHSFRIASTCIAAVQAINRDEEHFPGIHFSSVERKELEFAALVHDFGKVYIEPELFLKAKKLYPYDYEKLHLRHLLIYRSLEGGNEEDLSSLRELMEQVRDLNEPTVSDEDPRELVRRIAAMESRFSCMDPDGKPIPLLTEEEMKNLSIRRGSLNEEERKIIESHVERSYDFVKMIPWPREFQRIPDIVRNHHEKLDGSGYPRGLKGDQISLSARILAVADIFDALSASDRPYKAALSLDTVLEILQEQASSGKLDKDVVHIWIRDRIWRVLEWD